MRSRLPRVGVQQAGAAFGVAGVDAEIRQIADERVVRDLERQRRERLLVVRLADFFSIRTVGVDALHRRHVDRRRQVVDHGVEQELDALVLEGRATHHRDEVKPDGAFADPSVDLVLA